MDFGNPKWSNPLSPAQPCGGFGGVDDIWGHPKPENSEPKQPGTQYGGVPQAPPGTLPQPAAAAFSQPAAAAFPQPAAAAFSQPAAAALPQPAVAALPQPAAPVQQVPPAQTGPGQGLWGSNPQPQAMNPYQSQFEATFQGAPSQNQGFVGRSETLDPPPAKPRKQLLEVGPTQPMGTGFAMGQQPAMPSTQPWQAAPYSQQVSQSVPSGGQGGQGQQAPPFQAHGQNQAQSFLPFQPSQNQYSEPQGLAFGQGGPDRSQSQLVESIESHGFGQFPAPQPQFGLVEGNQFPPMQGQGQMSQPFQQVGSFSPAAQMAPYQFQLPKDEESRSCSCGQPALLLSVKKEGPNQGRSAWLHKRGI